MTRLSSGLTDWYRVGAPLSILTGILGVRIVAPEMVRVVTIMIVVAAAYTVWYGWRLSEVWLDGAALRMKGLKSFQVPLSEVTVLDVGKQGRGPTICVLGLDHPVGNVRQVRFIPADGVERELRARVHAARMAGTSRSVR